MRRALAAAALALVGLAACNPYDHRGVNRGDLRRSISSLSAHAASREGGSLYVPLPVIQQGPRPHQPGYVPQGDGPPAANGPTVCDLEPHLCEGTRVPRFDGKVPLVVQPGRGN